MTTVAERIAEHVPVDTDGAGGAALGLRGRRRLVGRMARRRAASPARTIAVGIASGAAATVAMTAYQTAVMKIRGGGGSGAPGEVVKRTAEGVADVEVPDERMGQLNNIGHFSYGTLWGVPYAFAAESLPGGAPARGAQAGLAVWGVSLVELPALDLAPPVWRQPPLEVALDISYHLVYGAALAAAHAALLRRMG